MDKKSLIFSIVTIALGGASIVSAWWGYASVVGIAFGIAAIVFYTITSKRSLTPGQRTMVKVGLILGIVGIVAGVIMLIVTIACACSVAAANANSLAMSDLADQISDELANFN